MKGYKDLEIYQLAFQRAVEIYNLSRKLSNPDKFETGGQIRRSSQTTKDTIVEGYGRKRYKADFIKYLVYSHSSCLESISQAEFIATIHPQTGWEQVAKKLDGLSIKLFNFTNYVETNWKV